MGGPPLLGSESQVGSKRFKLLPEPLSRPNQAAEVPSDLPGEHRTLSRTA
jgi:hypothetical protein